MTAPQSTAIVTTVATKGRILVVDDEADIREGLELLLVTEGYSVELAQNGAAGLLQ